MRLLNFNELLLAISANLAHGQLKPLLILAVRPEAELLLVEIIH
jgi:hypothetical protein